jgi:hypothetical protein
MIDAALCRRSCRRRTVILGQLLGGAATAREKHNETGIPAATIREVLRRLVGAGSVARRAGHRSPVPREIVATTVATGGARRVTTGVSLMRMRGLEPPRPYGHTDLNRARLPIPPHPRVERGF